ATVKITASVSQAGTVANSATASNAQGSTAMGSATTHVTPVSPPSGGAPPTATTGTASGISNTSATLGGQIAPGNQSTSYFFQYGTNTSYGRITAIQQTGTSQTVMAVVKSLTPGTV